MKSLHSACSLAALLLSLVTGCGGGTPGQPRVGFVTNNREDFWKIAQAGAKKAAAAENVDLRFEMPDKGDVSVQKDLIRNLMTQDVKAIAISVISPDGQKEYLDEIASKIPLITQDNDAPATKRICYIGTDNYEAGKAAGKLVKEALPEGGIVVVFVGDLRQLNAQQRRQGVCDELSGAKDVSTDDGAALGSKYKLHATYTDQAQGGQAACYEKALTCLTALEGGADKRPICMVGLWAYNPPAILSAVEKKEKAGKVKIVGFDEHETTLKGIREGNIYGTIVQNPYGFGEESVKLMAELIRGDKSKVPADGIRYVPHRVITKEGGAGRVKVDDFQAELNKLLGK